MLNMFSIIDLISGEDVGGKAYHANDINAVLRLISGQGHSLKNLFVQATAPSKFGMMAEDWLGA